MNRRSLWSAVVRYRFGSLIHCCGNDREVARRASPSGIFRESGMTTKAAPSIRSPKLALIQQAFPHTQSLQALVSQSLVTEVIFIKMGVDAVLRDQLPVRAALDDAPVFERE